MIHFTVPYSLPDCVSRLETSQSLGASLTPYTKVDFRSSTAGMTSFRFELWIASIRLAFVSGSLVRESDTSTRVQGVAIANSLIQMGVMIVVAVGLLSTWQRIGGDQRAFLPIAVVFVLIGPGLTMLLRGQVTSALRRALQ